MPDNNSTKKVQFMAVGPRNIQRPVKDSVCCPSNPWQPCPEPGVVLPRKYNEYYDVFHFIRVAGPVDPNDFDSPVYNRENVHDALHRNSDILNIANRGNDFMFIRISHRGTTDFSRETPVFPNTVRTLFNVFELRVRSPTAGLPYSVSEYGIGPATLQPFTPREKVSISNQPLPPIDTNWLPIDLTPLVAPVTFRIQVAVSIAGIFSAAITNSGNTQVVIFNAVPGPALVATGLYIFEMMIHRGDSINFRYSATGGTIQNLRVIEITQAVA